ncbi:MAG: hypothetical protein IPQ13_05500 [Holophagaceae bacterium]|nr:hypothetical protein [Holophagaceae bacterium]
MKLIRHALCWSLVSSASLAPLPAQTPATPEATGLPGDHFILQGALELFKKSDSPEAFEKALNEQANHVNNLDLNGDGEVDYVRVVDRMQGGVHALVLQVAISESENQDIAVIGLEKTADANAIVQIVGDEEIFGERTIVEPGEGDDDDDEDASGGNQAGRGPNAPEPSALAANRVRVVVNVWPWPCVRFVFAPAYVAWTSPWRWRVYPAWWRPFRPLAWAAFHPFRSRLVPGFAVVRTHRVLAAHRLYAPGRAVSVTVRTRYAPAHAKARVTRTTTVRTGPHGGKVKTTHTTVRGGRRRH